MDRKRVLAGAAAVALLTLGAGGVAYAGDGDAISGPDAEKAKEAALAHTNGGRVTDTEVGDEEGYYEVEVTRDDGSQTDVHLDRDLDVVSSHADDQGPDDDDGSDDDRDDDDRSNDD